MKNTQVKVNFYLDVGELTRKTLAKRLRTLANRPKTLANESLAKRLVGETTAIPLDIYRVTERTCSQQEPMHRSHVCSLGTVAKSAAEVYKN